jgi:hypothetical protein
MGLFVCSKCHCVENTALGWWWSRNHMRLILPPDMKEFETGKGLCSECLPSDAKYSDGTPTRAKGKWHGKFPKEHVDDFMKGESGKYYRKDGDSLTYVGK